MEPCDGLTAQHLRHFEKASQMNTLTPRDDHLLLHYTTVTDTHCAVGHILQQPAITQSSQTLDLMPQEHTTIKETAFFVLDFIHHLLNVFQKSKNQVQRMDLP
jgi:hypothetical protein